MSHFDYFIAVFVYNYFIAVFVCDYFIAAFVWDLVDTRPRRVPYWKDFNIRSEQNYDYVYHNFPSLPRRELDISLYIPSDRPCSRIKITKLEYQLAKIETLAVFFGSKLQRRLELETETSQIFHNEFGEDISLQLKSTDSDVDDDTRFFLRYQG